MPRTSSLQPTLAALLAVGVFVLGLAVRSPQLHALLCPDHGRDGTAACERLHDPRPGAHADHAAHRHGDVPGPADHPDPAGGDDTDHACAVTLFAAGCEMPVPFALPPPATLHAERVASFAELLLARTLRGPERICGPPTAA